MFTLRGRILGGLFSLGLAVACLLTGTPAGWLFLAAPVLLAWGYVRYGPMVVAFRAYREQDWRRLAQLLGEVRRPEWLRRQDRAYFAFLRGVLAHTRGDAAEARALLAQVDPAQLRTDHLRCLLECGRAEAALAAGDRAAAARHLAAARETPHRAEADPELTRLESLLAAG